QKETYVRIGGAPDRQSRVSNSLFQFSQRIAAPVMTNVILHSPKKHERRHEQKRATAGPQHSTHFAQARQVIVEMLDYIKPGYEIKRRVFVRQSFRRALLYFRQATRATEFQCFARDIDTFGRAEL